jgi:two-component system chemotaxis response regulator CheY
MLSLLSYCVLLRIAFGVKAGSTRRTMKDNEISTSCEPAGAGPRISKTSQRILVVDDEPQICRRCAEALTQHGYEVNAAKDGEAGWEALNEEWYDLIITDNNMPKVSGVALLKKMRAVGLALPVIMIAGEAPEEEFRRYPWLRPEAMLLKPFAIAELLGTVERVLIDARRESAYFRSLNHATAQLNFDWESIAPIEAIVHYNRGSGFASKPDTNLKQPQFPASAPEWL